MRQGIPNEDLIHLWRPLPLLDVRLLLQARQPLRLGFFCLLCTKLRLGHLGFDLKDVAHDRGSNMPGGIPVGLDETDEAFDDTERLRPLYRCRQLKYSQPVTQIVHEKKE